jgi:hypothetical protein
MCTIHVQPGEVLCRRRSGPLLRRGHAGSLVCRLDLRDCDFIAPDALRLLEAFWCAAVVSASICPPFSVHTEKTSMDLREQKGQCCNMVRLKTHDETNGAPKCISWLRTCKVTGGPCKRPSRSFNRQIRVLPEHATVLP